MFIDSKFKFVQLLEEKWKVIRDECLDIVESRYDSWIQKQMYDAGWKVFALMALGKEVPSNAAACPRTVSILRNIPGLTLAGFSRMQPHTRIKPHVGWAKSVYRLHLGLIVPDSCGLRVGNEERQWGQGKCLVFDDTVEHEAWNDSDTVRINLLLDFLRPGMHDDRMDSMPEDVVAYVNKLVFPEKL